MEHSAGNTIKRYLKIYKSFWRFAVIRATTYHFSFFIEAIITFGYDFLFFLFFQILFFNVRHIAGWNYYELMFFVGFTIVIHELLESIFMVTITDLPMHIKNGDLDYVLLKPVHSLFYISFHYPFVTILFGSISGYFLMIFALLHIHNLSLLNFIIGGTLIIPAMIICYSITIIVSSFAFIFINATALPRLGQNIVFAFDNNPHTVYKGLFKTIFFYIIPVVFINSIPAYTIVKEINYSYVFIAWILAAILLALTITTWNKMVTYYTSASS